MIYSVHNPVTGLFDYYEGGPETPINDDLPTPQLRGGPIGVAAMTAGRPLPAMCRRVGAGALPVGSVSSGRPGVWRGTSKTGIPSGLGAFSVESLTHPYAIAGALALVGCGAVALWYVTRSHEEI